VSTGKTVNNLKSVTYADKTTGYLAALGERIGRVAHLLGGKRALAQRLGIHESMLYRYIKGENALSAPLLLAIAEAGDVSLDWLASGKGTAPASLLREPGAGAYRAGRNEAAYTPVPNNDQAAAPSLAFDAAWLLQLCGARGEQLCLIEMRGDAMEPTLRAGDLLLIDRRVRRIAQDGLYAVQLSAGVEVKRVQKQAAGAVLLGGDNPRFKNVALTAAAAKGIKLLGRVVWFGRRF
jgi:phage repressor protein C with HTH and peptisase S24 domain